MIKRFFLACVLTVCACFEGLCVKYTSAMKPFLGEWVCQEDGVEMVLTIDRDSNNNITVDYKAINYEDGYPRTFYTYFDEIKWKNGSFIFSYESDDPYRDLLIKDIAKISGRRLTLYYQCWEYGPNGYGLKWKDTIGTFYKE